MNNSKKASNIVVKMMFIFSVFINTICIYSMSITREYTGDAIGSNYNVALYEAVLFISICFILYFIINFIPQSKHFDKIKVLDERKVMIAVEVLMVISLFLKLCGFIFFGYGVAESKSSLDLGFIFRLIPTSVVFMCLLIIPEKFNKRYLFYIILNVSTMIMMGWTGGLFELFWILIFRFMVKRNSLKYTFLVSSCVFFAFLVAPYIYSIKFYIRWGADYEFDYLVTLSHLLSRLSFSPMALYLFENAQDFVGGVSVLPGFTLFDSVTAVLPRSLLGISIDNLETLLVAHFTGAINPGVVYYLTLPGKIIASYYISTFDFFVSLFVLVYILGLLVFFIKAIFGDLMLLPWGLIIFKFFLSGNYEEPAYIVYGLVIVFALSHVRLRFR